MIDPQFHCWTRADPPNANRWKRLLKPEQITSLAGCITQALWVAALFTLRRAGVRHKTARTRIPEPFLTMRQDEYALWVQLGSPPVSDEAWLSSEK